LVGHLFPHLGKSWDYLIGRTKGGSGVNVGSGKSITKVSFAVKMVPNLKKTAKRLRRLAVR
jgi:hypothetical protein